MIELLVLGGLLSLVLPGMSIVAVATSLGLAFLQGAPLYELVTLLVGLVTVVFAATQLRDSRREFLAGMTFLLASLVFFFRAPDWLYLYIAWEFISISSYVLVALLSTEPAKYGAKKTLIMDRISGLLLLSAVAFIHLTTGSFEFGAVPPSAALLVLLAAMVKSSQFPFFWAHNAAEEPASISALHLAAVTGIGPLMVSKFPEQFLFLSPWINNWVIVSVVIASLLALVQEDQKKLLAYSAIATSAFLFTVEPAQIPLAFSIHTLLLSAYFILIETYSSSIGYYLELGLSRRSLSSVASAFIFLSLSGVPFLGLFWFKHVNAAALVTTFFLLLYFFRMYSLNFSSSVPPREGLGTYLAIMLAATSLVVYPWAVPAQSILWVAAASLAALVTFRLKVFTAVGKMLNAIFLIKPPEMEPPEQAIENWGYGIGKKFQRVSDIVRKAFTGPVSRDVAYIAVSLAALALGVGLR